ncbi:hypothetical protein PUR71_01800 [Streptomyces sp. SP17BM10]|uniref:hypothetical protein n=1 Tax=Streptomyces sp. SP17BM10 TaxID=3002530 RepID=UPI002E77A821|nr:hypothetical protein [Streptomyces sp. SP17BM10]MEE1781675.1 hypothetical protein [Streptomyces sp. SP17BM10]
MYSYDVSATPGRTATVPRSIPGMRPSYDAEHPHSTTPIYDELYSEYRRLFRALPGDRSGEEDLKFTGFAIREGYPMPVDPRSYPQQQAFQTYGGQAAALSPFMPAQQANPHPANPTSDGYGQAMQHPTGHHPTGPHTTGAHTTGHHHITNHQPNGHHPNGNQPSGNQPNGHQAPPAPQFTNGQGWVAAGFLGAPGPIPHPMPAPPPVPSPVMGTAPSAAAGGRHRQMLSLPPGRTGDHH